MKVNAYDGSSRHAAPRVRCLENIHFPSYVGVQRHADERPRRLVQPQPLGHHEPVRRQQAKSKTCKRLSAIYRKKNFEQMPPTCMNT